MRHLVFVAMAAGCLGLMACSEQSGENADSAIEQATQGHENAGDGPLEQAGESADEARGVHSNTDVGDAINDATDGKESTRP